jgi:hypothetical protein
MLKMQIDPTMCMKTKDSMTKCHAKCRTFTAIEFHKSGHLLQLSSTEAHNAYFWSPFCARLPGTTPRPGRPSSEETVRERGASYRLARDPGTMVLKNPMRGAPIVRRGKAPELVRREDH